MSNVLIGIIGVILFIGLALAGALFLGPRFQESRNTSIASAQVAAMKQLSDAVNMYVVQEGKNDLPQNDGAFVTSLRSAGYLKSDVKDVTGKNVAFWYSPTATGKRHVLIGAQEASLCQAVNKQAGVATMPTGNDLNDISGQLGCIRLPGDNYVVYVAA
jgi:hypothetical protein